MVVLQGALMREMGIPRAIVPVHLYCHPADLDPINAIGKRHNVKVIEDNAQAPLAAEDGRYTGTFGDIGVFSLNRHKHIQAGEGGICVTDDDDLALRLRLIRNHGENAVADLGISDLTNLLGFNFRMTNMQAAIGLAQLEKLEQFTESRIAHAAYLNEHLGAAVQIPTVQYGYRHAFHQYTIRVPQEHNRDDWAAKLLERGIATAVHYPCPIHRQPSYVDSPDLFRIAGALPEDV